jgi:hypothetical protein
MYREQEPESGAFAGLAIRRHRALVRLEDAGDDGQVQATVVGF